jgi:hypothetical protein
MRVSAAASAAIVAGDCRWRRYQLARGWPTARQARTVPTAGAKVATA